jgi:hypothetical protein
MADVLPLLLLESSFALLLALKKHGALSSATVVLVSTNLDAFRPNLIFSEKGQDVLILKVEGKPAKPHPCIISH